MKNSQYINDTLVPYVLMGIPYWAKLYSGKMTKFIKVAKIIPGEKLYPKQKIYIADSTLLS